MGRVRLHVLLRAVVLPAVLSATIPAFAAGDVLEPWMRKAVEATHAPAVSDDGLWTTAVGPKAAFAGNGAPKLAAFRVVKADREVLTKRLLAAPRARVDSPAALAAVLTVPMPDGTFERFAVVRVDLLAPDVQARFPDLHTFRAQGIDDPSASARLELSPFGFRAYVMREGSDAVIDPVGDGTHYRVFHKRDAAGEPFSCGMHEEEAAPANGLPRLRVAKARPNGNNLRTYRFAASLTGEYTRFFANLNCPPGSAANCPETAAAAALTTTMNRVTGLMERDTAVRFTVVATNIFTDPASDPFANGGKVDAALLDENQAVMNVTPGNNAYDLGHVFTTATGGSGPGRACSATKARGGTGRPNPSGDPYDVDYVAHELGHQLSASHTWTGTQNSCSADQFTATSAFEPGSGSTIMGYAGICAGDNLQPNSDAYFHVRSIDQITDFRNDAGSGGACGTLAAIPNAPPSVNAGPNFTIPRDTPFVLTATGSDADGQPLTFAWEQYDTGAQVTGIPPATQATGPLFRSLSPTASASRTFPRIEALLGTASSPWEVLPNVDRTLNFRVTARDNRVGGGGTDFAQMSVTVSGAPFFVSSPNAASSLQCGTGSTLSWTVGGGNVVPTVRADYSGDNGTSFASLIGSTANDGSEPFTVPRPPTANGRMRLAANGNIFFDISPRFAIVDTLQPTVTPPAATGGECSSPSGTPVALGIATTADVCDLSPALSNNAPSLFPLGTTTVTWSSRDASGNTGQANQLVTIVDTKPPVVTPPPAVTAECTGPSGTPVNIGLATAADVCDASLVIGSNAPALFPLGATTVTWSARDDSNNTGTATQLVRIVDTTPPELAVALSPDLLWPPNHKLERIQAALRVTDVCDPNPTVRLISATSSEPDDGLGDGDTVGDIQGAQTGTDDREFQLRSERSGTGPGRVYTIVYEAHDASGNATVRTATVVVPHDRQ